MTRIPLAEPNIGEREEQAVMEALASGYVSSVGPQVTAFEQEFADYVGAGHAIACSSGTAALHVALRAVGVGPGADVLCADFTFAGSANPIAYQSAEPTFIDSEPKTWNIDPALVREELDRRAADDLQMPAAIEVVHILGQPADLAPILQAAGEYGIPVIEDAAESLGARWSEGPLAGQHTGTAGRIGCFSFNGNKIVTAGGGGMVVTDEADLAARVRHLTTQAKIQDSGYLHDEVGYNYRLTNLAAALGLAQLRRIDQLIDSKNRIANRYDEAFADLPLTLPPRVAGMDSTYWLYSVLTRSRDERDALLAWLQHAGVSARTLWRPLSDQPSFAGARTAGRAAVARDLFDRGLSLPSSTNLLWEDQWQVIQAVRAFYGQS